MTKVCGATTTLDDGTILSCDQTEHPFPTHSDNGHTWGDDALLDVPSTDEVSEEE